MEKEFKLSEVDEFKKKSDALKKKWKSFRGNSPVFTDEERRVQVIEKGKRKNEWGFCISKLLTDNSIFFLGINPSAPWNHLHTNYRYEALKRWNKLFEYQRKIAEDLGHKLSYWDIIPVRMTNQESTVIKFGSIVMEENGRSIIRDMFNLTRQAIEITDPIVVYVCNSDVSNMVMGKDKGSIIKPIGRLFRGSNVIPLSHPSCRTFKISIPDKKRKIYFYYNTMVLRGVSTPVLLGSFLGDSYHKGKDQAKLAVKILKGAMDNAEHFYERPYLAMEHGDVSIS